MKQKLLSYIKKLIKKQYSTYSNEKIDEIMYGIESLYISITKTIIIFIIAYFVGIAKEVFFLLISFNIIRFFAFGLHASKSSICLIFSSTLFISNAFICKYVMLSSFHIYLLYLIAIIMLLLFAPADTKKRPLINAKKRKKYKILSLLIAIIYFFISIFINNSYINNYLIFGLLIECILINPITYKLFKMPYNNYKNYGLNTK